MDNQGSDLAVAPRAGFEPATNRLTAGCSTAELPGTTLATSASNKAAAPLQSRKSEPAAYLCMHRQKAG